MKKPALTSVDIHPVLAIGTQAPAEALGEGPALEREIAPRERIPLDQLIISGKL